MAARGRSSAMGRVHGAMDHRFPGKAADTAAFSLCFGTPEARMNSTFSRCHHRMDKEHEKELPASLTGAFTGPETLFSFTALKEALVCAGNHSMAEEAYCVPHQSV